MHSFIPPKYFFNYLTLVDIQEMSNPENVVIVQSVGTTE